MTSPQLDHIPGGAGLPVVGHTLTFLRDARALVERERLRHGDVFQVSILGRPNVVFLSPQATREIYLDPGQALSSTQGWASSIGPLFGGGLMLRDFDDHHRHRRVMQQAFSRAALNGYVERIHEVVDATLDELPDRPVDAYRVMKQLTLDLAARVFVGVDLDKDAQPINDAFVAMMRASVTPLRVALPGTPYRRGLDGRARLDAIFESLVAERRTAPPAEDLLSRLSHATTESGEPLPVDDVVDHMVFLLLAAHDTTTATLAVLLWELARNDEWQDRVVAEVSALDGAPVTLDNHATLSDLSLAMNEAMRLSPPVPFSPRVAVTDVTIDGWEIPAGAAVTAASLALHRHPDWWTGPDVFDPDRFGPERAEQRQHSHLFVPFGGGAHLCIGNHLAELVTKAVVSRLLARRRISCHASHPLVMQPVPIPKPRGPLVLTLS